MDMVKPRRQSFKNIIFSRKNAESFYANADGRFRSSSFVYPFHDIIYDADGQRQSRRRKFKDLLSNNASPSSNDNASGSHNRLELRCLTKYFSRLPKPAIIEVDESSGRNVLHSACRDNLWFHTVRKIVRNFPDAVEMPDNDLKTPLHHAAEFGTSTKIISFLLAESAKTLLMKDSAGKTPLHLLCEKSGKLHLDETVAVQKMVSTCPEVLEVVDDSSQTPLHIASERCSLEVIQWLIQKNKKSLSMRDKNGKTPLHHFLLSMEGRNKCTFYESQFCGDQAQDAHLVILSFCAAAPMSLLTNDECGMRPLEYAIMYGSHYEIIKELQELTKWAVQCLDKAYIKRGNCRPSSVLRRSRARIEQISWDESTVLDSDLEEMTL